MRGEQRQEDQVTQEQQLFSSGFSREQSSLARTELAVLTPWLLRRERDQFANGLFLAVTELLPVAAAEEKTRTLISPEMEKTGEKDHLAFWHFGSNDDHERQTMKPD